MYCLASLLNEVMSGSGCLTYDTDTTVSVSTGSWEITFHQVLQVTLPKIRDSCIAVWNDVSFVCLDGAGLSNGMWPVIHFRILEFKIQNFKVRISNCAKGNFSAHLHLTDCFLKGV